MVKPIPAGYHTITPSFAGPGCAREIEFLKSVFDAKVVDLYADGEGRVMHCELRIGDSVLMCGEGEPGTSWLLHASIYVEDCDATFRRAVAAGAKVKEELVDKFYGDRSGRIVDPFGNEWVIATHKEDLTREQIEERMKAMHQP
jgi:PhnB protein